ncbi:unnamed protein product, partial [Rotaria socialis]
MANKKGSGMATRGRNLKNSEANEDDETDDGDDDDEETEPMDFERAFGSASDIPKLEFMNIYPNNRLMDGL